MFNWILPRREIHLCTDDFSGYSWIMFMKRKNNASPFFKDWVRKQTTFFFTQGYMHNSIRIDRDAIFRDQEFQELARARRINFEWSVAYAPRRLKEWTWRHGTSPANIWRFSASTGNMDWANYLKNWSTTIVHGKTSYEMYRSTISNISHLKSGWLPGPAT